MTRPVRLVSHMFIGLASALVLLFVLVYGTSEARFRTSYDVPASDISLAADSSLVARGAHIVAVRGCAKCHGTDLAGKTVLDKLAVGRIAGTNLTTGRGGVAGQYRSGADWDRAIRHGVAPGGRALLLMPAHEYAPMSDDDVRAVVAYVRSLPGVDRETPAQRVGPIGRVLFLTGQVPLVPALIVDHDRVGGAAPPEAPTVAYGAYLAAACTGCHGATFTGGPVPGAPPDAPDAANLTPDPETGLGRWTEADFTRVLTTGVRPDGRRLDASMPVAMTKALTPTERAALWAFFQSLPPTRTL